VTELSRRTIIKAPGAIGAAMLPAALPAADAHDAGQAARSPSGGAAVLHMAPPSTTYVFFNAAEAAFIEAAVARLIPADEQWPGALEAGVANYRYLQCWDVPNVFSLGGSSFPHNITYNYTITIAALTLWALDAIKSKYLKSPGPMVPA
jgi:hypothetical protein